MKPRWSSLWGSLVPKLALISGVILLLGLLAQAIFTIRYHAAQSTQNIAAAAELLGDRIDLGGGHAGAAQGALELGPAAALEDRAEDGDAERAADHSRHRQQSRGEA